MNPKESEDSSVITEEFGSYKKKIVLCCVRSRIRVSIIMASVTLVNSVSWPKHKGWCVYNVCKGRISKSLLFMTPT